MMSEAVETIKNLSAEDYEKGYVNLHIHTAYSDGTGDFRDIAKRASEKYKVFSITDHNTVQGHIDNPDTGAVVGAEFDVWYKYIFLHLLAYGIDPAHESMQKFYSKDKNGTEKDVIRILSKRNIKELIEGIHTAGGIAVLAHPACCWALSMDRFIKDLKALGLDGVEVYYPYSRWRKYFRFSSVEYISEIADKYGLVKTGGTDCHGLNP